MKLEQNVTTSSWIYDINIYKMKLKSNKITYWIHRTIDSNGWLLTNFDFDITNLNLKTNSLQIAEKRSIFILNNKNELINDALNTLSRFTDKVKRNSVPLSSDLNKKILNFSDQIKNF